MVGVAGILVPEISSSLSRNTMKLSLAKKTASYPPVDPNVRHKMSQMNRKVAAAREKEEQAKEVEEVGADDVERRGEHGAAVQTPTP